MDDAPQDDWLQAARMEALEAEVRRLQAVEDALAASQAEGAALRGLLWEFTPDEESYEYDNEDGECRFCGTSSLLKKPPYPHTADCLVTRARALLTPPAAPGADTSAPVTD